MGSLCRTLIPRVAGMVLAVCLAAAVGCGRKNAPDIDTAPLKAAIETYLKEKSMGMAVYRFIETQEEGDTLTAKVSLYAADMPQVKVRWQFTFQQDRAGAWVVIGHKQ